MRFEVPRLMGKTRVFRTCGNSLECGGLAHSRGLSLFQKVDKVEL